MTDLYDRYSEFYDSTEDRRITFSPIVLFGTEKDVQKWYENANKEGSQFVRYMNGEFMTRIIDGRMAL